LTPPTPTHASSSDSAHHGADDRPVADHLTHRDDS
jgi:hypothetical protein